MTRRLLFALLALGIAQAAVYLVRPTTSYRLLAYGEGAREVGLVAAAFALLPIFLAIPLGRLSDRRAAPLLGIGCAVQTVGCLLLATATTTPAIAATSAVIGLGHLALALGAQDVVARESDHARHDHHFGLLTAGVSLGQLAGPLLAALILGDAVPSAGATTRALL
ncbi:MAG: MFS transporter, partial [Actinobacteria bacterium]|nr:MFS transporter [Actinomycetota bacterium]